MALIVLVVVIFAIVKWRSRSKFEWPVTGTTEAADTAYSSSLGACQDAYNQAMITAGTDTALQLTAERTRSSCISTASGTYVQAKCTVNGVAITDGGVPPAGTTAKTAYDRYTSDQTAIQAAYVPAQRQIASGDISYLNASRKADISGATRRYIATACPSFYKPSGDATDLTTTYQAWTIGDTTTNGLRAPQVTAANISAWADYAGVTYTVNDYYKAATPAAGAPLTTLGPITLVGTTGLVVGNPVQFIYQTPTTVSGGVESTPVTAVGNGTIASITGNQITITLTAEISTGVVLPIKSTIAKALKSASTKWNLTGGTTTPNWKLARDAGAGTFPQPTWATTA
jgi:hypothetical protein